VVVGDGRDDPLQGDPSSSVSKMKPWHIIANRNWHFNRMLYKESEKQDKLLILLDKGFFPARSGTYKGTIM
jgi:hypothetical protein